MRPELAYLLGAYLSDGYLNLAHKTIHPTWFVKDEAFANCIGVALARVGSPYSLYPYVVKRTKYRGWYVREKGRGRVGEWLHKVSPSKGCLPYIPRELVRPLVTGLMDGDGWISMKVQEGFRVFQLGFLGTKGFVVDFYNLLGGLGVKQGRLRKAESGGWTWSINIESFLAHGLNFAMPRKQARLAFWCCQMSRSCRYPKKVAIAKGWMKKVWSQDTLSPIPIGTLRLEVV